MHTGQRAIELPKSASRRRGATFEELAVALGISNSSLRRWARRKKRDGSSRVLGAHFIRGRWVLLGKLTPKRVESIRSGLNLHENRPPEPMKWKWRSKDERIATLEVEIQRIEKALDLLPNTYHGVEGMEVRRLTMKQMSLEAEQLELKDGIKRDEETRVIDDEKKRKREARLKMGNGSTVRTGKKNTINRR
jgi:transcriptional regulator with XRE-family HTH domain